MKTPKTFLKELALALAVLIAFIGILALPSLFQKPEIAQAQDAVQYYGITGPCFSTPKTLAPTKACTTEIFYSFQKGSYSIQPTLYGLAGDSVIIQGKLQITNWPENLESFSTGGLGGDSIVFTDTIIGRKPNGIVHDYSLQIPPCAAHRLIFTALAWGSIADSAKTFQPRKCQTPAK